MSKASTGHDVKDSLNPSAEGAHKEVMREEHFEQLIIIIPTINIKIGTIFYCYLTAEKIYYGKVYLLEIFSLGFRP